MRLSLSPCYGNNIWLGEFVDAQWKRRPIWRKWFKTRKSYDDIRYLLPCELSVYPNDAQSRGFYLADTGVSIGMASQIFSHLSRHWISHCFRIDFFGILWWRVQNIFIISQSILIMSWKANYFSLSERKFQDRKSWIKCSHLHETERWQPSILS